MRPGKDTRLSSRMSRSRLVARHLSKIADSLLHVPPIGVERCSTGPSQPGHGAGCLFPELLGDPHHAGIL